MEIALVGNPNVGKSTVFNGLTGLRQHTGNWPGKTVETAQGTFLCGGIPCTLVDLPGTYSLFPRSAEEEVVRDYLISGKPDAVIVVCDAGCLERNLILALQVIRLCPKTLICVNLMDEAKKRGIHIDLNKLAELLRVPVIGITARKRRDLARLLHELGELKDAPSPEHSDPLTDDIESFVVLAERIAGETVYYESEESDRRDRKLDKILTSRLMGFPIMFLLLALIFWLTLRGSNIPSGILSNFLFGLQDKLTTLLTDLNAPSWINGLFVEGCFRTLAWVVSVMLPPMLIFFPLFTFLEDLGYLPRVAFNLDQYFKNACACGKQALTMCQGFGCNAVGVTGCRIIDSPRERLIAIITNSFVPCNGRFPAMLSLISMFLIGSAIGSAFVLTAVILLGIIMTLLVSRFLSLTLLKGEPSSFTLELPPYRKPQLGKIIIRSIFDRSLFVLKRAAIVAAPAGLLIWILANVSIGDATLLTHISEALDPIGRLMGLDGVILMTFILALPANEIVVPIIIMAYAATGSLTDISDLTELRALLVANGWTWVTAMNTIIFSLMHWPCSTTILTIKKETGSLKWTAVGILVPAICGFVVCVAVEMIRRILS